VGGLIPLNFSVPFAHLECNPDAITLNIDALLLKRHYVFPKQLIESLEDYSGLFSKGLQIRHLVDGLPEFIVFWTRDREGLKRALRQLGYPILPG
jgi:hypothetical protein